MCLRLSGLARQTFEIPAATMKNLALKTLFAASVVTFLGLLQASAADVEFDPPSTFALPLHFASPITNAPTAAIHVLSYSLLKLFPVVTGLYLLRVAFSMVSA
eukprot:GHVT01065916.1.p2 GENE.GHVT01065916.1~~GHVT01065916.1.p2  ORF type:complete len:103 (+),score=11.02 GHVT01065916.1:241-549(+)